MRYVSTRGTAPTLGFDDVLLAGLARDGGLYVPGEWPAFTVAEIRDWQRLDYADVAERVIAPYVSGSVVEDDLPRLIRESCASFRHAAVTPLVQLDADLWILELFHGPTLAFKDVALQLLGRLFDAVLTRRGERITIVGATSGDTGSAAIEACRDREAVDIVILHPLGRTSEVQRRQMTTVDSGNVANVAIRGTFDDCQDLIKAMFADDAFRDRLQLSAVNSINWARIMAQIAYYAYAATRLGAPDREVAFAVPTGNFGNIFAAYAARRMGVPVRRLVIGSNANDILTRFFEADDMSLRGVVPTLSPSMDIQVSSNFERLLFELHDRNGPATAEAISDLRTKGKLSVGANRLASARSLFAAASFDDEETLEGIRRWYRASGIVLDPHTAVGALAARKALAPDGDPVVVAATAHPAKFPDAVERAIGHRPEQPARLADVMSREERYTALDNDLAAVQRFVEAHSRAVHATQHPAGAS